MGKIKGQHSWDQTTWAVPSAPPSKPQRNLFARVVVGIGKMIGGFVVLLVIALIGVAIINMFSSSEPSVQQARVQETERPESPTLVRVLAEDAVKQVLKDPDSAKFGDVQVFQHSELGKRTACGTVNAKNGFGGYTGMQYFITNGTVQMTLIDDGSKEFRELWKLWCKDQPEQPSASPQ